jgi:hypothetical protein
MVLVVRPDLPQKNQFVTASATDENTKVTPAFDGPAPPGIRDPVRRVRWKGRGLLELRALWAGFGCPRDRALLRREKRCPVIVVTAPKVMPLCDLHHCGANPHPGILQQNVKEVIAASRVSGAVRRGFGSLVRGEYACVVS